jgi:PadR family transcriptional regulator PadR
MPDQNEELLKGTLEMLILQALEREPMHGWGIADRIEQSSREVFRVQTGTLYPSLHRLLLKGWISAGWRTTENNRRARYYRLTPAGRKRLEEVRASWERTSVAINRVLDALS